jgi:hypothetical protein
MGAVLAAESGVTWITDAMLLRWLSAQVSIFWNCVGRVVILAAERHPGVQTVTILIKSAVNMGTCFTTLLGAGL